MPSLRWIFSPDPLSLHPSWPDLLDDLQPSLLPPFLRSPSLPYTLRIDGLDLHHAPLFQSLASSHGLASAFFPSLSPSLLILEAYIPRLQLLLSDLHSSLSSLPPPLLSLSSLLSSALHSFLSPPSPWLLRSSTLSFQLHSPLLMGILNVTPDSFSDGGLFFTPQKAIDRALSLIDQGADILDIGGESTRPGSLPISPSEEMDRILPVIEAISKRSPIPISVDTSKAPVAEAALLAGAQIVNDVSLLRFDPSLASVAARYRAPLILMHSRHTPAEMQKAPFYRSLWSEIFSEIQSALDIALAAGLPRSQIALDPGLGFSKRLQDNYRIASEWPSLRSFGLPILFGASRKSFLGSILSSPPEQRLEGSLAFAASSALAGVDILRVHDVASTRKLLQVLTAIRRPPLP